MESNIQRKVTQLGFYSQVSTSKEVRKAADENTKVMSDWQSKMWMRDDLYKMIRQYKDNADKDGSYEKLDNESKKYIKTTLEGMEETGVKFNE
jgi:Zn-dependent oligopeptidase